MIKMMLFNVVFLRDFYSIFNGTINTKLKMTYSKIESMWSLSSAWAQSMDSQLPTLPQISAFSFLPPPSSMHF